MRKRAKRQKIGLTTQEKTTDYIDPRNPYITQTTATYHHKITKEKVGLRPAHQPISHRKVLNLVRVY